MSTGVEIVDQQFAEQIPSVRDGQGPPAASNPPSQRGELAPLAVSVDEFCRLTSLKRTSAFKLIGEGRLEARHVLGRTVVLMRSIEALLQLERRGKPQ